ncbi:hypothetical protein SAMN05421773_11571 [Streptomyces aidingensis]|uniref:Uncharacterized protein n=1 Tax=Streptomyces aidingensis TaxID=910347 RepID=A0A1I1SC23_9ACTN|nr:hypothetical protein SAMN05421773_11571 [Streptomyces aidingensis]
MRNHLPPRHTRHLHTLTATMSWTATGTDTSQPLPDAVLETTHELTVQEIQAITR